MTKTSKVTFNHSEITFCHNYIILNNLKFKVNKEQAKRGINRKLVLPFWDAQHYH